MNPDLTTNASNSEAWTFRSEELLVERTEMILGVTPKDRKASEYIVSPF